MYFHRLIHKILPRTVAAVLLAAILAAGVIPPETSCAAGRNSAAAGAAVKTGTATASSDTQPEKGNAKKTASKSEKGNAKKTSSKSKGGSGTSSGKKKAGGSSTKTVSKAGTAGTQASMAAAVQNTAAGTSASGNVIVSLAAMDDSARAVEETAFFQVLNGNPVQILNYGAASSGFRWVSMAGGQETASCWSLAFQAAAGTAADGTSACQVQLPLKTAMGGRTLLSGESLQAIYDDGSGLFYELTTVIGGGAVAVTVPYIMKEGTVPRLLFVITSGWWAPSSSAYDYLAIGNSITLHPRVSYWPDAMGMGATRAAGDYYHVTAANLQAQCSATGKAFSSAAMNYAIWEVSSGNRSQYLYLLDPYLSSSLDLVSIQLGENAMADDAGFAADFPALIQYIRKKAPKAEIVIVGNFWKDAVQEQVKIQTAAANGCRYADLSPISITVYPGAVGSPSAYTYNYEKVYNADGAGIVCTEPAVNLHPNDAGMSAIAGIVLQTAGSVP